MANPHSTPPELSAGQAGNEPGPPQYTAVAEHQGPPAPSGPNEELPPEAVEELNAAFASLQLPAVAKKLEVGTCLAHLKLLSTFQTLKEDIGYTDGLFDIFDTRAVTSTGEPTEAGADPRELLARLREKRWALYVARAVDRYETWWNTFDHDLLTERDMEGDSPKYMRFPKATVAKTWLPTMLPPLGKSTPRPQ
jgi:hypothetical protein